MDDDGIDQLIWQAWKRLRERILGDPDELRRRLARRRLACMTRPPRAWCVGIRAHDKRINEATLAISPHEALYPEFNGGKYGRHQVVLDTAALRRFCGPVTLDRVGEERADVAKKLGVNQSALSLPQLDGVFRVRHVPGRRKRIAMLNCAGELDPSVRGFARPDRAFGWTGSFWPTRVPEGIEQIVERVPYYVRRGKHFEQDDMNPEQAEARAMPAKARRSRRLPPPEPDNVWYKWKGDEFLGYDWRWPGAKEAFEAQEARKLRARAAAKKRYQTRRGPPRRAVGSLVFNGWRWLCPGCARTVSVLLYPLPPINVLAHVGGAFAEDEVDAVQPSLPCLACMRCHRAKAFSRVKKDMWNEVITWLSGGLLFGSEVPKPGWWTPDRKRAYAPKPNAAPPTTRPKVAERLLKGWNYKQIAADLGIHWHTVDCHAQTIYRQHRVHSRAEFQRAMGVEPRPTKGELIRRRLEAGQAEKQIAVEMGIGRNAVSAYAGAIRRRKAAEPQGLPAGSLEQIDPSL